MGKFIDEIFTWVNPSKCNFLVNINSKYHDKIIERFSKSLEDYSDEHKRMSIVPLNGLNLQKKALGLENAIRDFKNDKFNPNEEEIYCIALRNKIINGNLSKGQLIEIKKEIFEIERKREDTGFRYIKYMLLSDLLLHMMILETKKLYPDILNNQYLNAHIDDIEKYYSYFKDEDIDIEKLIYEVRTPLSNIDLLYPHLKESSRFFVYILKYGEYISDFLLQEVVNDPMFNQRSGVISFNYLSADAISHRVCGRFYLEETHDINTVNGDFIKNIKNYKVNIIK